MKIVLFFLPFVDIVTEAQRSSKLIQDDNKLVDSGTAWAERSSRKKLLITTTF